MEIKIEEKKLDGFNQNAKDTLKEAIGEFADDIIAESNRLESHENSTGKGVEITSSIVNNANVFVRKSFLKSKKKSIGFIILKVIATITLLLSGIMYNPDHLQSTTYLLIYIIIIAAAILTNTLTFLKE